MQVELNYGRHKLPVGLPDDFEVTMVRKPVMPVLVDPSVAVQSALETQLAQPRWTMWRVQPAAQ